MAKFKFFEPSEKMVRLHGNFTCVWCRVDGKKVKGKVCSYKKSISFKKETCCCDKHIDSGIKAVESVIESESGSDYYTEADYQTWLRL